MSVSVRRDPFPRAPLFGAAGLVILALLVAIVGRLTATPPPPDPHPTAQQQLRFADRADGAVLVFRDGESAPFTVVTGQAGFLRGTLRSLARERRADKIGSDAPFRLSAWPDGRLTLDDTATGRRIELEAFGSDNAAVYARLLTQGGHAP